VNRYDDIRALLICLEEINIELLHLARANYRYADLVLIIGVNADGTFGEDCRLYRIITPEGWTSDVFNGLVEVKDE